MNYETALDYIHNTNKFGIKLGLENIRELLRRLDDPQSNLKFIHVAGTNGKGSVTTFISSVLEVSGYRVGKYISPYIKVFNERISINGEYISDGELAVLTGKVKRAIEGMTSDGYNHPTEFEIVTAIAFLYYAEKNCDIVVLEVGLGGRYDSTNIIDTPLVSVITPISIDHEKYLGDTLDKIAYEKAGIIKENADVVCANQVDVAQNVLCDVAREKKAYIEFVQNSRFKLKEIDILQGGTFEVEYLNQTVEIHENLIGKHQIENAKLAFLALEKLACKGFNISAQDMKVGFEKAKWSGRLEIISQKPLVIIDGAHNRAGADALYKVVKSILEKRKKLYVIIGVMADKDVTSIVHEIIPLAHKVYAVTPDNPRSMPANELKKLLLKYNKNVVDIDAPNAAYLEAKQSAEENDVILAYGSLYYIGMLE